MVIMRMTSCSGDQIWVASNQHQDFDLLLSNALLVGGSGAHIYLTGQARYAVVRDTFCNYLHSA